MAAQDPTVSTESNGAALVGTAATFLVITWFSVSLRTYARAILLKTFEVDDWLMIIAQINYTISCAFILIGVQYGLGRHNKSLDQEHEIGALKYQALATITYIADMMFIKFSIGFFLLRLAVQRRYTYTIYGSIFVVGCWSLVLFFWNLFQCHPVAAQWDYTILQKDTTAFCVDSSAVVNAAYSLSALTVLSDWFYALIPIPMIWSVKMSIQAKATVVIVLGLGVFASIATLIRLKFLADLTDLEDLLFATTDAMVWTLIEPGVAIIASCLVTIRPLLRAWNVKGFSSAENSSKRTGPLSNGYPASRTTRSNMPGFGSSGLTSIDVEAGQGGRNRLSTTVDGRSNKPTPLHMLPIGERTSEESELTDGPTTRTGGAFRQSQVPSEEYIIEGALTSSVAGKATYRDGWQSSHSANSSEVELNRMEPLHTQSDGQVGLGSPTGR